MSAMGGGEFRKTIEISRYNIHKLYRSSVRACVRYVLLLIMCTYRIIDTAALIPFIEI